MVGVVGVDLKPKSLKKGNIGLLGLGLLKIPFYFWKNLGGGGGFQIYLGSQTRH